jgi:hypothetical protein
MPTFTPAAPGAEGGAARLGRAAGALAKSKSCSDLAHAAASAQQQSAY